MCPNQGMESIGTEITVYTDAKSCKKVAKKNFRLKTVYKHHVLRENCVKQT